MELMGLGSENTRYQECILLCTWIQEFSSLPIQALTDPDKCNRANPASQLPVGQVKVSENILKSFALNM